MKFAPALALAGVLALGFSLGSLNTAAAQDDAAKPTADAPAADGQAAREKAARKLMSVMNTGGLGKFTMDQMADTFEGMPGLPPGFVEKFQEMVTGDDLVDLIVPIYVDHYTVEEMQGAIDYYESDIGKRFVAKQGPVLQDVMKVSQEWGQQKAMEVLAELDK